MDKAAETIVYFATGNKLSYWKTGPCDKWNPSYWIRFELWFYRYRNIKSFGKLNLNKYERSCKSLCTCKYMKEMQ